MSHPRTAVDQALLEQLAVLANQTTRMTEEMAQLRGLSLNNVLWAGTVLLDADGRANIDVGVTYASFGAWALGAAITVTSSSSGATAPAYGPGVFPMPGGTAMVWPMAGHELNVYGTAGDRVVVALWSTPQCPMVAAAGSIDGGGA